MIMTLLKQIINTYHGRGFKIYHILADRQFESVRKHMEPMGMLFNTTGHDEHAPEIEQLYKDNKRQSMGYCVHQKLGKNCLRHR